jgi:hypothetical protein
MQRTEEVERWRVTVLRSAHRPWPMESPELSQRHARLAVDTAETSIRFVAATMDDLEMLPPERAGDVQAVAVFGSPTATLPATAVTLCRTPWSRWTDARASGLPRLTRNDPMDAVPRHF